MTYLDHSVQFASQCSAQLPRQTILLEDSDDRQPVSLQPAKLVNWGCRNSVLLPSPPDRGISVLWKEFKDWHQICHLSLTERESRTGNL